MTSSSLIPSSAERQRTCSKYGLWRKGQTLVVYHHGKSGLGFMIGLHRAPPLATRPGWNNMTTAPFGSPRAFRSGFRETVPVDAEGYVHCPALPGLGIEWDSDWLRQIGLA